MNPPRVVRVGPHRYQVLVVPNGVMSDAGRFGHASIERLVIALDADQPHTQMADTLIHELIHALMASVDVGEEIEERVALTLGPGLLGVFRDNPRLVDYLTAKEPA